MKLTSLLPPYKACSVSLFFIMYVLHYVQCNSSNKISRGLRYCTSAFKRSLLCGTSCYRPQQMFSQASGRHPPGDDHCSGWYASFWNAFLFYRHLVRARVWPAVKSWQFPWYKGQILAYLQGVLNTFEPSHNMYYSPFYQFYLYYLLTYYNL